MLAFFQNYYGPKTLAVTYVVQLLFWQTLQIIKSKERKK